MRLHRRTSNTSDTFPLTCVASWSSKWLSRARIWIHCNSIMCYNSAFLSIAFMKEWLIYKRTLVFQVRFIWHDWVASCWNFSGWIFGIRVQCKECIYVYLCILDVQLYNCTIGRGLTPAVVWQTDQLTLSRFMFSQSIAFHGYVFLDCVEIMLLSVLSVFVYW